GSPTNLGDTSTVLDRMAEDLPRVAVLWEDWNPSAGGGVFASSRPDRLVVSWNAVPLFGTTTTATFQLILFSNGTIQMNFQSVSTTPMGGYLTGVSPGSLDQFHTTTINLSQG